MEKCLICKTKELEELRAVPEGSSEWVEAKARLDAAVQAAVTAGLSIACTVSSPMNLRSLRLSRQFPSQAVRKQSSWKHGQEKPRSGSSNWDLKSEILPRTRNSEHGLVFAPSPGGGGGSG